MSGARPILFAAVLLLGACGPGPTEVGSTAAAEPGVNVAAAAHIQDGDLLFSSALSSADAIADKNSEVAGGLYDKLLRPLYKGRGKETGQEIEALCDQIADAGERARSEYAKVRSLAGAERYAQYVDLVDQGLDIVAEAIPKERVAASTLALMLAAMDTPRESDLRDRWQGQTAETALLWERAHALYSQAAAYLDFGHASVPTAGAEDADSVTVSTLALRHEPLQYLREGCWSSDWLDKAGAPNPAMEVPLKVTITNTGSTKSGFIWLRTRALDPADAILSMGPNSWGETTGQSGASIVEVAGPQILGGETRELRWSVLTHTRAALVYEVTAAVSSDRLRRPAEIDTLAEWSSVQTTLRQEDCSAGATRP